MSNDFDWSGVEKEERIVIQARETMVYLNTDNDVVIRQRAHYGIQDEDPFLVIPIHRVPALIDRLNALMLEANAKPADCPIKSLLEN